jgi:hypothetical protein
MLLALEVAIEYWLALTFSLEARSMAKYGRTDSHEYSVKQQLQAELELQKDEVWQFIVDRYVALVCVVRDLLISWSC